MTGQQFPADPSRYPEPSQATTVLVLGILSIVVCAILGPFAWVMGNRELEAIDTGRRPPDNRGTANAGRILGIVGTVFLVLIPLAFLVLLIAGVTISSLTPG